MRKFLLLLITLIFFNISLHAQEYVKGITHALQKQNIPSLTDYFDKMVDITINNNMSTYSNSQAIVVVREFYNKNNIQQFQLTNIGDNGTTYYMVGKLIAKTNEYLVYFMLKPNKQKKYLIQELKIESI